MRSFLLVLTLIALLPCAYAGNPEVLDGIAAIVNSNIITYSDVRDYIQPVLAQLRRNSIGSDLIEKAKAAQMDALNNLIERSLILQDFKEKGYSFPETVVDEQLNNTIANEFGGNRAALIKTLEAENLTLAKYREQLRDRIIVQAMRSRKTQNEVVVSPYKILSYYQAHLADYKVDDQIKLRMITIKKLATPESEDTRRKLTEEVLAKLDAGTSFDNLAKLHSEGKEGKQGGDWGWVGHDELRKELSTPAFQLKPGQHSRVIETTDGYYILQVDEINPAHTKPLTEVRGEIEIHLLQDQRAKMEQDWVKQLRAKAFIRLF
ncbi:MAG: peptidyl-prolyl cis-trans isomerase [Verrucomicrobiota bacterium]